MLCLLTLEAEHNKAQVAHFATAANVRAVSAFLQPESDSNEPVRLPTNADE